MAATQFVVIASTVVIFILSSVLAAYMTKDYLRKKTLSPLFWSIGLWLFALGVALESFFAAGVYSEFLIGMYLFIVAALVNSLAIGSIMLIKNKAIKTIYYIFSVVSLAFLLISVFTSRIGNVMITYVVAGVLPLSVITSSSLVTGPAAVILVVVALKSYLSTKDKKMLSIIAGVVVVSVAGGLYIAAFPAFLYYSEFIGVLLLWIGFFRFNVSKKNIRPKRS